VEDYRWIDDTSGIAALDAELDHLAWLTVDTESNSMHVYQERICLIQLNLGYADGRRQMVVIDPLQLPKARESLGRLAEVFEDPALPIWLHGGEYDVVCFDRDYGIRLQGVWDSQQAAAMLGFQRSGYGAVVEQQLGVKLAKAHAAYDWATRPLDEDALGYAIDDVRYLPDVIGKFMDQVAAADIEEELAIANRAVEEVQARATGYDPSAIWRLKGIRDVPQQHLPILVALHRWRDELGAERDCPPGRIIANELLVALARNAPTAFGQLKRMRMRSSTLRDIGDGIIEQVKAAKDNPPDVPAPVARREPDPREREREKALKAWRREESERREVPTQLVLPARALEHLKRFGGEELGEVPQLGDKRIARYGATLRKLAR
jgi:ribonuclease D